MQLVGQWRGKYLSLDDLLSLLIALAIWPFFVNLYWRERTRAKVRRLNCKNAENWTRYVTHRRSNSTPNFSSMLPVSPPLQLSRGRRSTMPGGQWKDRNCEKCVCDGISKRKNYNETYRRLKSTPAVSSMPLVAPPPCSPWCCVEEWCLRDKGRTEKVRNAGAMWYQNLKIAIWLTDGQNWPQPFCQRPW